MPCHYCRQYPAMSPDERATAPCSCPNTEPGTDRRQSTPEHRASVHLTAMALLRIWKDDYPAAIARATFWTRGADARTFAYYADVATLLSRRYATLTDGRGAP